MSKEVRQLPEWSKDIKKWMGEQGAMTNLQRDFIFFIEDSIVQPMRKKMLDEKDKRVVAEKKCRTLNELTDNLAEQVATQQLKLDKFVALCGKKDNELMALETELLNLQTKLNEQSTKQIDQAPAI